MLKSAFFSLKRYFFSGLLGLVISFFSGGVWAYETDQYTTPKAPLADIGEDLSLYVFKALKKGLAEVARERMELPSRIKELQESVRVLENVNARLSAREKRESDQELRWARLRLQEARTEFLLLGTPEGVIQKFRSQFSGRITWEEQRDGVFGAPLGLLPYEDGKKNDQAILFDAGKTSNVYSFAGFHRIISPTYFVFSSTLRAYDVYFGVDKLGHFFNQGYQYQEIYRRALRSGYSELVAIQKAIDWGVDSEDGFFGQIVDGVYSNADLAANFAGFIFYQNLFHDVTIQGIQLPAVVTRTSSGVFVLNKFYTSRAKELLQPYFTQHFNEAFNPSILERPQRAVVKGEILDRCKTLLDFYSLHDRSELRDLREGLQKWNGQDYGVRLENTLKLDQICF